MGTLDRKMLLSFRGGERPRLDAVTMVEESRDPRSPSSSSSVTRPGELPWRAGVKSLALFFVQLKSHLVRYGGGLGGVVWRGGPDSPVPSLREAWRKRDSQQWIHKWFGMYRAIDLEKIVNVEQDGEGVVSAFVVRDPDNRPFFRGEGIAIWWDEHPATSPDVLEDLIRKIVSQETAWTNPATVVTAPRPSSAASAEEETVVTIHLNRPFDAFDDHELAELLTSLKRKLRTDVEIVVEGKRRGSVILDLRLPDAAARRLLELFRAGDLADLDALSVECAPAGAAHDRAGAPHTRTYYDMSASGRGTRRDQGDGEGMRPCSTLPPVPSSADERELWDVRMPAIPGYEMLKRLDHGGMGVVWKARHVRSGEPVALKCIRPDRQDPDTLARFRREAAMLASLHHPNVVEVRESGEHDGRPYMVMEYLDGVSLKTVLRDQPLPVPEAVQLVEQVATALDYIHRQGIVHRDVKPQNILLADDGTGGAREVKVVDFGIARRMDTTEEDLTNPGQVVGTPDYIAPELVWGGTARATPASDLYSLGVILYQLLTSRTPFARTPFARAIPHAEPHDPVRPSILRAEVPPELDEICMTCLQPDPSQRFASADAFVQALQGAAHRDGMAAARLGPHLDFPDDPILDEQLRTLDEHGDLTQARKLLGRLIASMWGCAQATVCRLSQGLSGAPILRVEIAPGQPHGGRYILKIARGGDASALKHEQAHWPEIAETCAKCSGEQLLWRRCVPRYPCEEGPNLVRVGPSYALAQEMPGGVWGESLLDLHTAYTRARAGERRLVELAIRGVIGQLRRAWYDRATLKRMGIGRMWDGTDASGCDDRSIPPYRLPSSVTARLLSSVAQLAPLGERLLGDTWWLAHRRLRAWICDGPTSGSWPTEERPILVSSIHGDLNAHNILVCVVDDGQPHPVLVDFGRYRPESHTFLDFACLEAEIKFTLMDRERGSALTALDATPEQLAVWRRAEDHLCSPAWQDEFVSRARHCQGVKRAVRLIKSIRSEAQDIHRRVHGQGDLRLEFLAEYALALLYRTLQKIGAEELSHFKRLLAVYSALRLIQSLGGDDPPAASG
jgi:serine/threonine protein kinase